MSASKENFNALHVLMGGKDVGTELPLPECWGRTPLHLAAKGNFPSVVAELLEHGATADLVDEKDLTPLLLAGAGVNPTQMTAVASYERVVSLLVKAGADVTRVSPDTGMTALHVAAILRSWPAAHCLLEAGAEANRAGTLGSTPLHEAAAAGALKVVELLLEQDGVRVDVADQGGRTPLHKAAYAGSRDVLALLLSRGADLAVRTNAGVSAVDALVAGLPRPAHFLAAYFDSCVHANDASINDRDFKIYVDVSVLCPRGPYWQMAVTRALMGGLRPRPLAIVFQHPLLKAFVRLKWRRLRILFLLLMALQCFFVLALSAHAIALVRKDYKLDIYATRWMVLVLSPAVVVYAFAQIAVLPRHYVREPETWLHLLGGCFATAVGTLEIIENRDESCRNKGMEDCSTECTYRAIILHLLSMAVVMGWAELMLLVGRFPTWGQYALMFQTVFINVMKVLLAFVCLVIGFALSFALQFSHTYQFSNLWYAIVRTVVMMTGEFEYANMFPKPECNITTSANNNYLVFTSRFTFLFFVILAPIVLMNLMMGLAVSDVQALQTEGMVRRLLKQADFVAHSEALAQRMRSIVMSSLSAHALAKFSAVPTHLTFVPMEEAAGYASLPGPLIEALMELALRNGKREMRRDHVRNMPVAPVIYAESDISASMGSCSDDEGEYIEIRPRKKRLSRTMEEPEQNHTQLKAPGRPERVFLDPKAPERDHDIAEILRILRRMKRDLRSLSASRGTRRPEEEPVASLVSASARLRRRELRRPVLQSRVASGVEGRPHTEARESIMSLRRLRSMLSND